MYQCVCVCRRGWRSLHLEPILWRFGRFSQFWSSVMWRFTVKKSARGYGKLQLYRAVFGFYLFGGGLFMLQYCRLLGDCEEIVIVECILLYLYSELVSATKRYDPVSRNAHINEIPSRSWAELRQLPEADKIRKRSRESSHTEVRQTTMAKVGTLPSACYETSLPDQ